MMKRLIPVRVLQSQSKALSRWREVGESATAPRLLAFCNTGNFVRQVNSLLI
jgi:hypothetical protein